MPSIDLTPSFISFDTVSSGSVWRNPYNVLSLDASAYAICPTGVTTKMYMQFYTPGHTNTLLPANSRIDSIVISYSARTSGSGSPVLEFNYFSSQGSSPVRTPLASSSIVSSTLSTSTTSSSATDSSPTLKWVDLCTLSNGRVGGNQSFGIYVKPASSSTAEIYLDYINVRVNYTTYNYLNGSRSRFHLNRRDLGNDVDLVNGVASNSSYIKRKDNSVTMEQQVRSEDVNLLGDALYNIENAILSSSGYVYATDLKKTYMFSMTLSAFCNSAASSDVIIYSRIKLNSGTLTASGHANLYNISRSTIPVVSGAIWCDWTSAIAWIESGTTTFPLYAHSQAAYFRKTGTTTDFIMTVSILGSSIGTTTDYNSLEGSSNAYQGYLGSTFTAAPASGKIFIKVLAMGRQVV